MATSAASSDRRTKDPGGGGEPCLQNCARKRSTRSFWRRWSNGFAHHVNAARAARISCCDWIEDCDPTDLIGSKRANRRKYPLVPNRRKNPLYGSKPTNSNLQCPRHEVPVGLRSNKVRNAGNSSAPTQGPDQGPGAPIPVRWPKSNPSKPTHKTVGSHNGGGGSVGPRVAEYALTLGQGGQSDGCPQTASTSAFRKQIPRDGKYTIICARSCRPASGRRKN